MEGYIVTAIVCTLCIATGNGLKLTMNPQKTQHVQVGDQLQLTCVIDEGVQLILKNTISFVHKNLITKEETKINKMETKVNGIPNFDSYQIVVKIHESSTHMILTILSVTADMDGEFFCAVRSNAEEMENKWTNTASVEVLVVEPPHAIEMTIAGEVISSEMSQGIKLKAGTYSVICKAVGSNPAASMALAIGGKDILLQGTQNSVLVSEEKTRRSYITMVEGRLVFTHELFSKFLVCQASLASDVNGNADHSPITASVELIGISEKPVVECMNSSSAVGDRYVRITCYVAKKPEAKNVAFIIGNKNKVLKPGEQTEDFTEVTRVSFNDTHWAYSLIIHTAERGHFLQEYYLSVNATDNKSYRYPIRLNLITLGASSAFINILLLTAASVVAIIVNHLG